MIISGHLEPSEAASSGLAINYAIELAGIVARRQLAAEEAEEATLALSELDSAAMSARYSAADVRSRRWTGALGTARRHPKRLLCMGGG